MIDDTDRKSIFINLIDSYLPQLTEDDLYKLHDLVRNTVESRSKPTKPIPPVKFVLSEGETLNESASPSIGDERVLGERAERRQKAFNVIADELKRKIVKPNAPLYGEDNIPDTDKRAIRLFERETLYHFSYLARSEIVRLGLNTAHYGIIVAAWSETKFQGSQDSGLDIFFGVRGRFDARVRLSWGRGLVSITSEDLQPVSEIYDKSCSNHYEFSEANLLKGLQQLVDRYKVAPKQS